MSKFYVKIFSRMLDSTIWQEDDSTRLVWITLLALSDEMGMVDSPIPALAARARVSKEACIAAMDKFQQPDQYSRTSEFEGRRVEKRPEGWFILNYEKYRQMMSLQARQEYKKLKQAQYRLEARAMDKEKTLRQVLKDKRDAERLVERMTAMKLNVGMQGSG